MGVMNECLPPSVQDGEESEGRAEMLGVGGDSAEGFGDGSEKHPIDHHFVLRSDHGDRFWHGEHDVEILGVEHFGCAVFDPRGTRHGLTRGTVAIPAGVVPHAGVPAAVPLLDMASQGGRSTLLDRGHDALLSRSDRGP